MRLYSPVKLRQKELSVNCRIQLRHYALAWRTGTVAYDPKLLEPTTKPGNVFHRTVRFKQKPKLCKPIRKKVRVMDPCLLAIRHILASPCQLKRGQLCPTLPGFDRSSNEFWTQSRNVVADWSSQDRGCHKIYFFIYTSPRIVINSFYGICRRSKVIHAINECSAAKMWHRPTVQLHTTCTGLRTNLETSVPQTT